MLVALPFLYEYSYKIQLTVLFSFLIISYFNRLARLVLGSLAGAYIGFKILIPLVAWLSYIFKGIAWLGFYIYFFQKAIGYALTSFDYLLGDGLESLIRELDKRGK